MKSIFPNSYAFQLAVQGDQLYRIQFAGRRRDKKILLDTWEKQILLRYVLDFWIRTDFDIIYQLS